MMKNTIILFLFGVVLVSNMVESASRSAAAPPAVDCSSLALTMADCLSYVTSGSKVQKPEGSCCSGLKTTLKTDAECLCEGFKNSAQLGITLNVTKALTLPAACHVSAPSVSDCGLSINLNGAPAVSPTASSPSSTTRSTPTPATSSGTTEIAAPPPPGTSGSALAANSMGSFVLSLLVAYFFSLLF